MPLISTDIFQARATVDILERRAQSAELAVASLQASLNTLTTAHETLVRNAANEKLFTIDQIQQNAQLNAQQATAVSPDLTLDNFIAALGLSIALAEATMPDRAISSVSATVQSFLTFHLGPDGVTRVPGLRLYQPELGASTALASTSFDLNKVVSGTAPASRSLYSVLMDKQALYGKSFWTALTMQSPGPAPALQIVTEIGKMFANIGSWSFSYLLQESVTIAGLETALSTIVSGSAQPVAAGSIAGYAAAAASLTNLTASLTPRPMYVAGDLYALSAALDQTTSSAANVHS